MMSPAEVIEALEVLAAGRIAVWLDGGWGVHALLGEQTRPHRDLDLVISRPDYVTTSGIRSATPTGTI